MKYEPFRKRIREEYAVGPTATTVRQTARSPTARSHHDAGGDQCSDPEADQKGQDGGDWEQAAIGAVATGIVDPLVGAERARAGEHGEEEPRRNLSAQPRHCDDGE